MHFHGYWCDLKSADGGQGEGYLMNDGAQTLTWRSSSLSHTHDSVRIQEQTPREEMYRSSKLYNHSWRHCIVLQLSVEGWSWEKCFLYGTPLKKSGFDVQPSKEHSTLTQTLQVCKTSVWLRSENVLLILTPLIHDVPEGSYCYTILKCPPASHTFLKCFSYISTTLKRFAPFTRS